MTNKRLRKKEMVVAPSKENTAMARRPMNESMLSSSFDSIFEDFRRSFEDLMAPFLPLRTWMPSVGGTWPIRAALVDLIDKGDKYVLKAELPGYNKNEIDVQIRNDAIELRAEKKVEEEHEGQDYLHRERTYSAAQRMINFPEEVSPEKAEAKMENGLLEIVVPKVVSSTQHKMKKIEIK